MQPHRVFVRSGQVRHGRPREILEPGFCRGRLRGSCWERGPKPFLGKTKCDGLKGSQLGRVQFQPSLPERPVVLANFQKSSQFQNVRWLGVMTEDVPQCVQGGEGQAIYVRERWDLNT